MPKEFNLEDFLNWSGKSEAPQTVEEANEVLRAQQAMAQEAKMGGAKLGDLLDKAKLQKAIPLPEAEEFKLVGEPQVKDFELVGKPYGGNVAKIPQTVQELPPIQAPVNPAPTKQLLLPHYQQAELTPSALSREAVASEFGDLAGPSVKDVIGKITSKFTPDMSQVSSAADEFGNINKAAKLSDLTKDALAEGADNVIARLAKLGGKAIDKVPFGKKALSEAATALAPTARVASKALPTIVGKALPAVGLALDVALTPEVGAGSDKPIGKPMTEAEMQTEALNRRLAEQAKAEASDSRKYFTNGTFDFNKYQQLQNNKQPEMGMAESLKARSEIPASLLPEASRSTASTTPPPPGKADESKSDKGEGKKDGEKKSKDSSSAPSDPMAAAIQQAVKDTKERKEKGYGQGLDDAALLAAQEQARDDNNFAMIGKALNTIIGGATKGFDVHNDAYNDMQKNSQQGVQDILTRRKGKDESRKLELEQRLEDATSPESILVRDMLRKANVKVPDDVSAGALKRAGIDTDSVLNRALQREQIAANKELARLDKFNKEQEKKQEKELTLAVPGFERTGEVLPKAEEAANFRKALSINDRLAKKMSEMRDLVGTYGSFEYGGKGGAAMKNASTEAQMLSKSLYELGVLNGKDLELLLDVIANPTSIDSMFTRDSTRQAQISAVLNSIKDNLDSTAYALGYQRKGGSASSSQSNSSLNDKDKKAVEWAKANKSDPRAQQILKIHGML